MGPVARYMLSCAVSMLLATTAVVALAVVLPYVSAQLAVPWKVPDASILNAYGYEQQCPDLGFCIVAWPTLGDPISAWLNMCWLENGFVWIGNTVITVMEMCFLIAVLISMNRLLPWETNPTALAVPMKALARILSCQSRYVYGFVLVVAIMDVFYNFLVPPLFWCWRTINAANVKKRD